MPYVRSKSNYKPETIKFTYDAPTTYTKTVKLEDGTLDPKTQQPIVQTTTETVLTTKEKKITLKQYAHSRKEDAEHFFICLMHLKKELSEDWQNTSKSKTTSAVTLFKAFDEMLTGAASDNWNAVMKDETDRSWETFKTKVAEYITTKVFTTPTGVFSSQLQYMRERTKPKELTAEEWWKRIMVLSTYLPYLFRNQAEMKKEFPDTDFKDWWIKGSLSEADERRIACDKVPRSWINALRVHDVGRQIRDQGSIENLINYYTTLESLEDKRARQTPAGRRTQLRHSSNQVYNPGGNNYRNQNALRDRQGYQQRTRNRFRQQGRGQNGSHNQANQQNSGRNRAGSNYQGNRQYQGGSGGNQNYSQGQGNGRGNFQRSNNQNRPQGGFQGQQFNCKGYQRPSGQSYFQEDQEDAPNHESMEEEENEQHNVEDQEQEEELLTEDQWIERWNESLLLDQDIDSAEELEELESEQFMVYNEDFYESEEESDDGGFAAFTGSHYV